MRLVLSEYVHTLRERDELDRLVADLVVSMGYVPLTRPQVGVRQHGVDLAAVGKSAIDGVDELLLFVMKQGDIGRTQWQGDTNSVRQSLDEVLDVYVRNNIAPEHATFRRKIIVATTGDLKEQTLVDWVAYQKRYEREASYEFWGGEKLAELLETHLLDEHLFANEDRADLRKALALAGDADYGYENLQRLVLRQLGLTTKGELAPDASDKRALSKAMRRVHLAAQICAHWAEDNGDSRQAVWIYERTALWTWHRILLAPKGDHPALMELFNDIWQSYVLGVQRYFERISAHLHVRDGMAAQSYESAEQSLVLFEHIGLLACVGLTGLSTADIDPEQDAQRDMSIEVVAEGLCAIVANNPAANSPRLDRHVVDLSLAFLFLVQVNRSREVATWLEEIAKRLDWCFKTRRSFPVGTDSIDDLAELTAGALDDDSRDALMRTSWCLPTVLTWCAIAGLDDVYEQVVKSHRANYPSVCPQIWHADSDSARRWYFGDALDETGESEAPFNLPVVASEMRGSMLAFAELKRLDWAATSIAWESGWAALDCIACRHFGLPVPVSVWYPLARMAQAGSA
jgi:hypothetical protein